MLLSQHIKLETKYLDPKKRPKTGYHGMHFLKRWQWEKSPQGQSEDSKSALLRGCSVRRSPSSAGPRSTLCKMGRAGMLTLGSWFRNQIQCALENCEVGLIF